MEAAQLFVVINGALQAHPTRKLFQFDALVETRVGHTLFGTRESVGHTTETLPGGNLTVI